MIYTIFIIFIVSAIIQLIYYWIIFGHLAFYHKKQVSKQSSPVSVVICAKNEFENLKKFLPLILEQDYPDFEVVVVNDNSDDESFYLLENFSGKYKNLSVVNLCSSIKFFPGKKFPLSLGIKSAKNDIILLTDADCYPKTNQWITNMQKNFTKNTEIVLGYGTYGQRKGLLNKLILFDTLNIAIQYFSLSLIGQTYMGVGRNLAYRKSLFYKNKGFISHYNIISGDDDLFISKAATKHNTNIEISPDSHTVSIPKTSFKKWMKQKKRHLSTGTLYKPKQKFFLGLFLFSQFLFFLSFIILISLTYNILIICSLFFIRAVSQLFILKKCMNKLKEKKILLLSPIFELFFILLNSLLAFSNLFSKKNKWK